MTLKTDLPNLDSIKVDDLPNQPVDSLSYAEEQDYAKQRTKVELEDLQTEVDNRKRYTSILFRFMVAWIVIVLLIVIVTGIKRPEPVKYQDAAAASICWYDWIVAFDLPESVVLALIGGTTANVIGLFFVVARYLFTRRMR
jgi:hypothetical protein